MISHVFDNIKEFLTYDPSAPMVFSSGVFWILFMLFIPIYGLLKSRRTQMVIFVIAFSLFFYYKSSGLFVFMLAGTSVIDWLISRRMAKSESRTAKRWMLAFSLTLSLGILGYFKYANFFLWNFSTLVGSNFSPLELVLPVGISFYTFQSVSYMIDVYKGRVQPTDTWGEYAFFLTFFPQLVAGPIVRADYFLPQIKENKPATKEAIWTGFWIIILGLIKKAVIADYIAQYNDLIFANPGGYSGFETMMGIIGYMMQIYCDFSGYSDMAIGIASIMGFQLAQNFNFPYKAKNTTDFWRRWHISLSTWLRDYVYIPLGGNRKGTARTYINNFVTMLVGGLWHGAAWKFIIWGGMHGVGLAVHKASKPWLNKVPDTRLVSALSWLITIIFIALTMVYFRADSISDAGTIIHTAVTDFSLAYFRPFVERRSVWVAMVAVIIIAHSLPTRWWERMSNGFVESHVALKTFAFLIVVQLIVQFRGEDVMPFIYFQF